MMPKIETIAAITRINPTANPTFLSQFSNRDLDDYLLRLRTLGGASDFPSAVHQVEICEVGAGAATDRHAHR